MTLFLAYLSSKPADWNSTFCAKLDIFSGHTHSRGQGWGVKNLGKPDDPILECSLIGYVIIQLPLKGYMLKESSFLYALDKRFK